MLIFQGVFAVQGPGILYILSWETTLVRHSGSLHDEVTLETASKKQKWNYHPGTHHLPFHRSVYLIQG